MSIHSAYTDSTLRNVPDETRESQPDTEVTLSRQLKLNWIKDPVTQQMLSSIQKEIDEMNVLATQLACSYPTHNNHQQVIQTLVKADTLRKVIDTYAS